MEQKLSKNLFITWEDEDEDEEKVLPSNAKNSKDEEEEMFGENEDEKKESPSGSPRRQRYAGWNEFLTLLSVDLLPISF